ncbi:uncharacterized mitochondrial protein AtMg00810-like [Malus sylvestris]|uniref:uncharacterized mitochondrial protein AtMg00810-like n=1 Tax=Malus sylvestris TaxID=3752 RepID=UPI0021ACAF3C|nr:uncharacterized mitochondrial protein AtMg00810-like [Malus sylvestris]
MVAKHILYAHTGDLLASPSEYRCLVGCLQYLTLTQPDIAFAVNSVAQYMSAYWVPHMVPVKCILRYIKGFIDQGLFLTPQPLHSRILAYSDADWAGCVNTRHSTTVFLVYLYCDNLSATYMAANTVFHAHTRHIELDYHFIYERVVVGSHQIRYLPSVDQPADLLTKGLLKSRHQQLRSKLVRPPPPSL